MEQKILVLTVSSPIPTRADSPYKYEPWSQYGDISLPDAELQTITVSDSDGDFENVALTKGAETEQRLTEAATFGHGSSEVTLAAGTQLSYAFSTILRDAEGNEFLVSFPRVGTGLAPPEVGGKFSVLVFPRPTRDASGAIETDTDGNPIYPEFDLTQTFKSVGHVQYTSTDYGLDYSYPSAPAAVDCFAQGTLIDTIFGPRAVETLNVGDMIRTRDNGMRWLAWSGSTHLDAARLDLQPNLRPVRISAGALGNGLPRLDLVVSPQHRILVSSTIAARMFGEAEILVAAKHLVGLPGIATERSGEGVTYWHLLFDGHELVQSNGAWTESLFTGPQALDAVGCTARREIFALFPDLSRPGFQPQGARRLLTGREGRQLALRLGKNHKAPFEPQRA